MRYMSFLSIVTVMGVSLAANAAVYNVPFFDNLNTTAGIFTDANGGKWGAYDDDFDTTFSQLGILGFDTVDNRWELNTGGGTIRISYESNRHLVMHPGVNQQPQPALVLEVPLPGNFSISGIVLFDGTALDHNGAGGEERIRFDVMKIGAGAAGAITDLFNSASNTGDYSSDLGAQASLQNIALLAGERIEFRVRKVGTAGTVTADLSNVVINGPGIPEPASIGLLAIGGFALLRRYRH